MIKYNENNTVSIFIKLLFIISTPFMNRLLPVYYSKLWVIIGILTSLSIAIVLTFKYDFIKITFENINYKQVIVAIIFSIILLHLNFVRAPKYTYISDHNFPFKFFPNLLPDILKDKSIDISLFFYILGIFSCFVFICFILNNFLAHIKLKQFFNIDKQEMKYITIITIIFTILIVIVSILTTFLDTKNFDIIYTRSEELCRERV